MNTSTLYQEYKREEEREERSLLHTSTMQASGLFHRLACTQLLLLAVILRVKKLGGMAIWEH